MFLFTINNSKFTIIKPMFCPKCGSQAIDGTKFCRSCGSDLEVVSAALTGNIALPDRKSRRDRRSDCAKDPDALLSSAITSSIGGTAFIVIAIFLTLTNTIGGSVWGFWLLIPGAYSLGSGIASYLKAKRVERQNAVRLNAMQNAAALPLQPQNSNASLPPQSLFGGYAPPARNTGELAVPPASVTENTTRHLQMNSEGETINLPQQK